MLNTSQFQPIKISNDLTVSVVLILEFLRNTHLLQTGEFNIIWEYLSGFSIWHIHSKFQFDLETVDEEPPRGNANANSLLLLLL